MGALGDRFAFAEIIHRHAAAMFRYALWVAPDVALGELPSRQRASWLVRELEGLHTRR